MNKAPLKKWWWRKLQAKNTPRSWSKAFCISIKSPINSRETLLAGWFYEMDKRMTGKYLFEKPFPEISREEIREAVRRWGWDQNLLTSAFSVQDLSESEVPPVNSFHRGWVAVRLNLNKSDDTIFSELKKFLAEKRNEPERRIPPSKKGFRPGSNSHREVGWAQIECWDRAEGGEVLNCADRGQKSRAELKYKNKEKTGYSYLWRPRLGTRQKKQK